MYRRTAALLVAFAAWYGLAAGLAAVGSEKPSPPKDDYYELYKMLADTVDQVDRNYVKEVSRRELIEAAIRGVVNRLDPYSTYIGPEELAQFRTSVENEFGGVGIQLSTDDGDLRVLSPIYGTPAYRAGILAGDRITAIDGKSTDGLSLDEAVARMKGKEGSSVTLAVVHRGTLQREQFTLVRERIRVETVLGDHRKPDDTWDFMLDPPAGIGYVRVTAFSRETSNDLRKALEDLKARKFRGLVVDLRFNPGGLLSSAIEVSNLFISHGRIVSTKGRNTPEHAWDAQKNGAFEGFPMVVLVNRYSASASEIVSACIQDHKRAVLVGERTWGKGSVQNIIDLNDGRSALKLTTAAFHRPSGKNIHRFPDSTEKDEWGVMPDPGYDCRLTDRETTALLVDRQHRDILQPGPGGPAAKPQAMVKADETKKTGAAAKPPAAGPGAATDPPKKTKTAGPGAAANPEEKAKTPGPGAADPPEEKTKPTAKPSPEATPAGAPDPAKTAQPDPSRSGIQTAPVVDRQLQMAVKYLSTELARAK
ncbi:MAG: S41 family peptidase [Thermoguttaceae bacterium]